MKPKVQIFRLHKAFFHYSLYGVIKKFGILSCRCNPSQLPESAIKAFFSNLIYVNSSPERAIQHSLGHRPKNPRPKNPHPNN
jgi:hypothetical protein